MSERETDEASLITFHGYAHSRIITTDTSILHVREGEGIAQGKVGIERNGDDDEKKRWMMTDRVAINQGMQCGKMKCIGC